MPNNVVFTVVDGYASGGPMPSGYIHTLPLGFSSVVNLVTNWFPVAVYNPNAAFPQFSWYYLLGNSVVVAKPGLYLLTYQ